MKKLIHILVIAFIVGLVCVSCRESDLTNNGEGALSLKIGVQRELPTVSAGKTRATLTDEELLQKCKVYIRNAEGLVRKFATLDEMPEQILLERVYNFKRDGYFGISSVWHSQYSSQSGSV